MAFEKFPATNTQEAIAVFKQDVGIVHDVAHGDENAEVLTENGLIPSIAKFIKDTNERISDGVTGLDHNTLGNRTAVDSHPISAITGLQTALDNINTEVDLKSDLTYVNAQFGLKADSSTLTAATGADFIGASDSGGLTLGSVQDQLNELKALVDNAGGGMFKMLALDTGTISAASSGDIIVKDISDVAGATHIKVTLLCTDNATETEFNMQIETENGVVLTGTLMDSTAPAAGPVATIFGISNRQITTTGALPNQARILQELYCTSFTVRKTTGVTSQVIAYALEYGVVG